MCIAHHPASGDICPSDVLLNIEMDERHESSQLSIRVQLKKVVMEWQTETVLRLIDEYEKYPLLWNAKHPFHYSRNKKIDAWEAIAAVFQIKSNEIKQKMNSLLSSFRREKAKGTRSIGTGKARKDVYTSKWFAFDRMHYLLDKDEPRETLNTEKGNCNEEDCTEESAAHQIPQENTGTGTATATPVPVPPKRRKRGHDRRDEERLEKAYEIMQQSIAKEQPDEYDIYSKYIANKVRKYTPRTRVQVERAINNILFEADMGVFDQAPSTTPSIRHDIYYRPQNHAQNHAQNHTQRKPASIIPAAIINILNAGKD